MSMRYYINNGETISDNQSLDWDGAAVYVLFFDALGDPAIVTGLPLIYRTIYESGDLWQPVLPFSNGEWRFNGPARRVRVDMSGVSGYTTYQVVIWRTDDPMTLIPDGAFTGRRAITVQPYTEANVKNGVQYYLRASWPLTNEILTGTTRKLWFRTGSKQVLVKLREFQYIAEEMRISLFVNPVTVTGGTTLTINNYNGVSPVAPTSQALQGVTTVSDGTPLADPEYFFGSQSAPQRVAGAVLQGRERVLPPNTEFIVAISNTGSGAARAEYFLDFYEGGTDLPLIA